MSTEESIQAAYATAKNYPDLAQKLVDLGIQSYTADVSTGAMLYRLGAGETSLHLTETEPKVIAHLFDPTRTIQAIRDNQSGKTNYGEFMNAIAQTGVRFYDAILTGVNKRVIYVGFGGYYEEKIPIV